MKCFARYVLAAILAISPCIDFANAQSIGAPSLQQSSIYLGNVATAVGVLQGNSTSNLQFNSRSQHVSGDNLVNGLQVVLGNWYVTTSTDVETGSGGTQTFNGTIEFPYGTCTPITWNGGSATVSVANLANAISDTIKLLIPKGQTFWVRLHAVTTAGILFQLTDVAASTNYLAAGTSVIDNTNCGSVGTPALTSAWYQPLAIIAPTRVASVFCAGDSRIVGVRDNQTNGVQDLGECARGIGGAIIPYISAGTAGIQAGNTAGYTRRAALALYSSHVISNYGINNLNNGNTLASLLSNLALTYSNFPGKPIWQMTLPPLNTTSDSCVTVANQTKATWDAIRVSFNDLARGAGIPGTVGIFDPTLKIETSSGNTIQPVRDGGFWLADGTTAGKYSNDCVHETYRGAELEIPSLLTGRINR